MHKQVICIDLGGTALKYGLFSPDHHELNVSGSQPTPVGADAIFSAICGIITAYLETAPDCSQVCISSAGIIDSDHGIVAAANEELMPNFTGFNLSGRIEEAFPVRCHIENDVNCAALAEFYLGAAKNARSSLTMTIGTGIGSAIIIEGRLIKGHTFSAGEIGYMHMEGCTFEQAAATSVLVRRCAEELHEDPALLTGKVIFDRALNGNEICIREIDVMCDMLAKGIANACYMINPEVVVIGGGISARWAYLRPRLEAGLDRYLLPFIRRKTRLEAAVCGNQAGMIGAYYASITA